MPELSCQTLTTNRREGSQGSGPRRCSTAPMQCFVRGADGDLPIACGHGDRHGKMPDMSEMEWSALLTKRRFCSCELPEWPPTFYMERTNASGHVNATVHLHWNESADQWELCPYRTDRTSDRARSIALEIANSEPLDVHLEEFAPPFLEEELAGLDYEIDEMKDHLDLLIEERRVLACRKAVIELKAKEDVKATARGLLESWLGSADELIATLGGVTAPPLKDAHAPR